MRTIVAATALALAALVGCGSSSSDPPTQPAKFSEIYTQIFPAMTKAKCNFCHSQPVSQVSNGKLYTGAEGDVHAAYAALVGQTSASKDCSGKALIVPGKPEESLFYTKLTGTPPCGAQMPFGGGALPDAQVEMVRSWIAAGANEN
jgi:hypothetical protein